MPENVPPGQPILVVDDDPDILRVLQLLFERNGFQVRIAPNGQEAVRILRKFTPAAVILDVMMPGISGFDVCRVIKREPRLEKVPVVFLTAKGAPQDFKLGGEAGAVAYVVKPFKQEKLLNIVRMLTSSPSPA